MKGIAIIPWVIQTTSILIFDIIRFWPRFSSVFLLYSAQVPGAVEYANCIFEKE